MSETDFEPITLVGCDENKVKKDKKKRYLFPFSLSAKPASDWTDLFKSLWRAYHKQAPAPKPKAYVDKEHMVLESGLADVKVHFEGLKAAMEAANHEYTEHLSRKSEKEAKKKRKHSEAEAGEREAIHLALEGLEFP